MGEPKAVPIRPIRWNDLRADEAQREIRRRLAIADPFVSLHAFDRLEEREEQGLLNSVDMMHILKKGMVCKPPRQTSEGWVAIVEKRLPGSREAGVVTLIFHPGDGIEVITVEWMDWL
jgi:hypothetical protein